MNSNYITVDSRQLKVFKGFIVMWVIQSFFIHYYVLNKYWFRNIGFGRILKTLCMPILAIYLSYQLLVEEFKSTFRADLEIYIILSESDESVLAYAGA